MKTSLFGKKAFPGIPRKHNLFFQNFSRQNFTFFLNISLTTLRILTLSHQKIFVRFPLKLFLGTLNLPSRKKQQQTLYGVIPSDL